MLVICIPVLDGILATSMSAPVGKSESRIKQPPLTSACVGKGERRLNQSQIGIDDSATLGPYRHP